jgi:hypothetical protein
LRDLVEPADDDDMAVLREAEERGAEAVAQHDPAPHARPVLARHIVLSAAHESDRLDIHRCILRVTLQSPRLMS